MIETAQRADLTEDEMMKVISETRYVPRTPSPHQPECECTNNCTQLSCLKSKSALHVFGLMCTMFYIIEGFQVRKKKTLEFVVDSIEATFKSCVKHYEYIIHSYVF